MLEDECAAVAVYVGDCLKQSPFAGKPASEEHIALFVSSLSRTLQSLVQLSRKRLLAEVTQGRRAIAVSLQVTSPDCPIAQAADYAGIDVIAERLSPFQAFVPRMFAGYAIVREGDRLRVLYPALQPLLDGLLEAFEQATPTPEGRFVQAVSADQLQAVTLQQSYPAYFVYEVFQRPVAQGAWQSVDRTGRDQLVTLLADAYHKGYWFARFASARSGSAAFLPMSAHVSLSPQEQGG